MRNLKLSAMLVLVALLALSETCFAQNGSTDVSVQQGDTIEVMSEKMGKLIKNTVIVPAQYLDEDLQDVQYPVVYLLHGYGGDYASWSKIKPELDDLASEYGMIIVCPNGEASWYWDSPKNPKSQYETYITKELIPYIDDRYRTYPDAHLRAITGLSMGGHGGLWLGFRHPELFGACGSMSGGVNILLFPEKWEMKKQLGEYATNKEEWERHTVINLVPTMTNKGQKIIIDCGTEDFFIKVNNELHEALLKAGIPHDYYVRPGKHNLDYWNNSIDYQLLFFQKAFDSAVE